MMISQLLKHIYSIHIAHNFVSTLGTFVYELCMNMHSITQENKMIDSYLVQYYKIWTDLRMVPQYMMHTHNIKIFKIS